MICPCKTCEKKGCGEYHSKCAEYLKYVEWRKYVNQSERKSKQFAHKKYLT